MKMTGKSEEELKVYGKHNFNLVGDLCSKINNLKGYDTAYGDPHTGKIIVHKDGMNYLVDIEPICEGDLMDFMKNHKYLIR